MSEFISFYEMLKAIDLTDAVLLALLYMVLKGKLIFRYNDKDEN